MARLNVRAAIESDDEFPDLSTILRPPSEAPAISPRRASQKEQSRNSTRAIGSGENRHSQQILGERLQSPPKGKTQASSDEKQSRKQRPLGPLKISHVNSLLLPLSSGSLSCTKLPSLQERPSNSIQDGRSSPKRITRAPVDYSKYAAALTDASVSSEDDDSFTDLSGFIVPDSASEDEDISTRSRGGDFRRPPKRSGVEHLKAPSRIPQETQKENCAPDKPIDLTSPEKDASLTNWPESRPPVQLSTKTSQVLEDLTELEEPFSTLKFSPPRYKSPYKSKDRQRPVTPPSSPSKSQLQSPSKQKFIPPSPHRPSLDGFWSADVINDWNDQYSPKKTPKSPGRNRLFPVDEDDEEFSPSESPKRSPCKSPVKKDKAALDKRKAFNAQKHSLATSFLAEVDQTIADSQVSNLAASTGGIKIIWSKKLSSTAGRANWRREGVRSKSSSSDGTISTTHRHHASIELAEKVIDDEDRLTNVLAHEYCHLANFMVSGVKDNPHGKEFKEWASKCTKAFAHRGIHVTTKHSYAISYKYIWACAQCGLEYQRHSKSIDPTKHSCGACKGKLSQVQPAPRKESEYQRFVKGNWERVKGRLGEGSGVGEVMALLAREFREEKRKEGGVGARDLVVGDEKVAYRDDAGELDQVARKLDFLQLGS